MPKGVEPTRADDIAVLEALDMRARGLSWDRIRAALGRPGGAIPTACNRALAEAAIIPCAAVRPENRDGGMPSRWWADAAFGSAAERPAAEDWRGEGLIRTPRPAQGEAVDPDAAPVRRPGGGVCAVPFCGRPLSRQSTSGVCRAHNHEVGICRCRTCLAKRRGERLA